jgi:hypothetical protein
MRQRLRVCLLALGLVLPGAQLTSPSAAQAQQITLQGLAGAWNAALIGNTGCGLSTMWVFFTLNSSGVATDAEIVTHVLQGSPCIDQQTNTSNTFTINPLNGGGMGGATLTCGNDCGWTFQIQVYPDMAMFNLVDVTDGNNLLQGVAVRLTGGTL